jgi:hypothetical protein
MKFANSMDYPWQEYQLTGQLWLLLRKIYSSTQVHRAGALVAKW